MLLGRAALLTVLVPGCLFEDPPPPCMLDTDTPIELVYADQNGNLEGVVANGEVPLVRAPQGGHILLIGAKLKVTGDSCQGQINAALRDMTNNRVVGLEQRPITIHSSGDGWASPADPAGLSDLANLAVCPNFTASSNIHDNVYQLEVRMMDPSEAHHCETTALVRPTCDGEYCRQECARVTQ